MLVHFYRFLEKIIASPARKNRTLLILTGSAFVINILIWLLILLRLRPIILALPNSDVFIPLHYNTYLGVDKYGDWKNIFYLPGIGLFIFLTNSFFALTIYNRKDILSYFLVSANFLAQLILLVATIFIILINL